jgi:hypothetical protein
MNRTAKFARFVIAFFALTLGIAALAADDEKSGTGLGPVVIQRP